MSNEKEVDKESESKVEAQQPELSDEQLGDASGGDGVKYEKITYTETTGQEKKTGNVEITWKVEEGEA